MPHHFISFATTIYKLEQLYKQISKMKSIFLISIFATIVTAQRGHGPKCIQNFYDKILNKPGFFGQNLSLIQETLHDDWNTRPNPLDPTGTLCSFEGTKCLFAGENFFGVFGF